VRQVVAALHVAGQYPSCNLVRARLSHPAAFRNAVVRDAWETSLRQYGWEKGTRGPRPLRPSGRGPAPRVARPLDFAMPLPGGD
jgi:hypothetical protein